MTELDADTRRAIEERLRGTKKADLDAALIQFGFDHHLDGIGPMPEAVRETRRNRILDIADAARSALRRGELTPRAPENAVAVFGPRVPDHELLGISAEELAEWTKEGPSKPPEPPEEDDVGEVEDLTA